MREKDTLETMHLLHLMLADELKRICEKHNIPFFMIAGSLLGAVRHHGFIPWDDDMDFGMLRGDYEKFIQVCDDELDLETFYLQTDKKENDYTFNFAKLRLNGTRVEEEFSKETDTHQGIYIDIFPIDVVPDGRFKKWVQFHVFYIARNLLWVKTGYGTQERKQERRYKAARAAASCFTVKFLKRVKYRSISRYAGEDSKYVVTADGTYGLQKETLQRIWVEQIDDYAFEDRIYPGIADYDSYLSYFYGDYMDMPPEGSKKQHNISVDFGEYSRL